MSERGFHHVSSIGNLAEPAFPPAGATSLIHYLEYPDRRSIGSQQ